MLNAVMMSVTDALNCFSCKGLFGLTSENLPGPGKGPRRSFSCACGQDSCLVVQLLATIADWSGCLARPAGRGNSQQQSTEAALIGTRTPKGGLIGSPASEA